MRDGALVWYSGATRTDDAGNVLAPWTILWLHTRYGAECWLTEEVWSPRNWYLDAHELCPVDGDGDHTRFRPGDRVHFIRQQEDIDPRRLPLGTEVMVLSWQPAEERERLYWHWRVDDGEDKWFVHTDCLELRHDELDELAEAFT